MEKFATHKQIDKYTQLQVVNDGYDKEVACITMPEGDWLSASIIVTLAHTSMSILELMAYWKRTSEDSA